VISWIILAGIFQVNICHHLPGTYINNPAGSPQRDGGTFYYFIGSQNNGDGHVNILQLVFWFIPVVIGLLLHGYAVLVTLVPLD